MSIKKQRDFMNERIKETRKKIFMAEDKEQQQILTIFLYDFKNTLSVLKQIKN